MGHGIVHDQGVRRREAVILSFRFFQNYIVFDLDVTTFLARGRRNFMNFDPVTHGTKKCPQFINNPCPSFFFPSFLKWGHPV